MSAFVIGQMNIHNRKWMDEYFASVPALIEQHAGTFIVRGGDPSVLEGENQAPDAVFVIEFPDREHALDFWNSEEFEPFVRLRQSGSSLNAILVDRLD